MAAQLIAAFSPSGDALAVASPDGRVRTFDSGKCALRAPALLAPRAATAPQDFSCRGARAHARRACPGACTRASIALI
eukprot:360003-Chlamydomonas_euryale.AAC.8